MFNIHKEYQIKASKDGFIKSINDQMEPVKSFRLQKYQSKGGKSFWGNIEKDNFRLYPNTVIADFLGDMQFHLYGKMSTQGNLLTIRVRFSPPVWISILILSFLVYIIIFFDYEWYSRLAFFIVISLYIFNFKQCKILLNELEHKISKFASS